MFGCTGRLVNISNILSVSRNLSKVRADRFSTSISQNAAASTEDEVLLETYGNKCLITLNRPKALNALNLSMVRSITPALKQWEKEQKVLIIIKGTGGRAFCAGGDVIAVAQSERGLGKLSQIFFAEEYQLNHLIATLEVPYVALIDGITMGGGVGLSVHGYYRVSTERTLFAMPETAIGFLPDVGGTYFLPRLKGKLGLFLGLTGYRLKGADVYHAGISTHAANSQEMNLIEEELLAPKMNSQDSDIESCLAKYTKRAEFLKQGFSLESHLPLIDECFAKPTVEDILAALESSKEAFATETVKVLKRMSPLSLKVTKRALDEGAELTLAECLQMEYRLSQRFKADHDFHEGVRALLIDKDQKPQWNPARLEDCTAEKIQTYFDPINPELEL